MSENGSDDIGYRRPPKHSQFRPGQSGNPLGRRAGINNFQTDLADVLGEQISIRENGVERKITKQRALLDALVNAAMRGDMRATNTLMAFCLRSSPRSDDVEHEDSSAEDIQILKTLRRGRNSTIAPQKKSTSNPNMKKGNENG